MEKGKTMTDAEKLVLIDHMIADAWEYITDNKPDGYFEGILCCIATVINMESEP